MTNRQKKIFIVDDNNASLTACKKILRPEYEVYPLPSAEKMFEMLKNIMPDLILLDVDMPEMNGYEAAGRLKKNDDYKEIPIIFLSGRIDPTSEMVGLNLGALDYIHKPFVSELLLRRIKTNLSLIEAPKASEGQNNSSVKLNDVLAPLNNIIDLLGLAINTEDSTRIKDYLIKANNEAKIMHTLIKSILDAS